MPTLSARRIRIRWPWVVGLVVAVIAAFGVGLATQSGPSSGTAASISTGSVAPNWSGTSLGGATLSSAQLRGRWVVLNFFATWCDVCVAETPQLVRFAATNPTSSVQVVGVVFQQSVSTAGSFVRSHGVTWPLLSDPGSKIASAYRVTALPQSFVIRPNGTLAAHYFGPITAEGLDKLVGAAT